MSARPDVKVEVAFGVGPLGDTVSATTSGSTDTGNTLTCPDKAALRWSTVLDLRFKIALSDWTPSSAQIIAQKDASSPNRGWVLTAETFTGTVPGFRFTWSTNGTTMAQNVVAVLPSLADGSAHWVRVKIERGLQPGDLLTNMSVYTSACGQEWTPYLAVTHAAAALLGITDADLDWQSGVLAPAPFACTADLQLRSSDHTKGTVTFHAFQMFVDDGHDPVASLDIDNLWAATDTTFLDRAANTWTIGSGITTTYLWTDVTPDWRGTLTATPMGRSSQLDSFNPGSSTWVLENIQRQYDPAYVDGPHYGQLVSRVPCRSRAKFNGTVYPLFRGLITGGWPQGYDPGNHDATVAVTATDDTAIFTDAAIPASALDLLIATDGAAKGSLGGYWALDSTDQLTDLSGNGLSLDVAGGPVAGDALVAGSAKPSLVMNANCNANGHGAPIAGYPFTVECWFKSQAAVDYTTTFATKHDLVQIFDTSGGLLFQLRLAYSGVVVGVVGGFVASMALASDGISSAVHILDGAPRHLAVEVTSTTATVYINGLQYTMQFPGASTPFTWANPGQVMIGSTGAQMPVVVDRVALWGRALAADEIERHNRIGRDGRTAERADTRAQFVLEAAGWPGHRTALTAHTPCQTYQGGDGKVLDYLRTIESTERGQLFLDANGVWTLRPVTANFSDTRSITSTFDFTEDDYMADGFAVQYDDDRIVNEADVTRDGGAKKTASDQTSINAVGVKSFSVSGTLNVTDSETKAMAGYYVWLGKDQAERIDALLAKPDDNPARLYPTALGARIGDKVTVARTPQKVGDPISVVAHLAAAPVHTIDADAAGWNTTLALDSQQAGANVITIGTWALGDGKVLGP